ncbi:MAG: hypothetical protein KGL53_13660, partial [Elusimicrobia bacterium]|nr:hypothetical protein [Elusimicrobiota bacterium]
MGSPGPSSRGAARRLAAAAAVYGALLALLHAPVLARLGSTVLAGDRVAGVLIWECWWLGGAWRTFAGSGPFFSKALMFPHGVPVGPHSPLALAACWLLQRFCGLYAAHDLFCLLAYLGAGLGMFALADDLVAHFPAALAAGFVFMFNQAALTQHRIGQVAQAASLFVPLLLLAVRRAARRADRRAAAFAALCAAGCCLTTPYVGFG